MTGSDVTCAWCGREVVFGDRHGEGVCTVVVQVEIDTSRLDAAIAGASRAFAHAVESDLLRHAPDPDLRLSADTPLVSRSPWLSSGAVRLSGEMFADGQERVVVSASLPDELFERIRESVDRAQRIARAAEQVDRMLADMQVQLLPWQRTVLVRVVTGDALDIMVSGRRAGRNALARALAEVCPACRTVGGHASTCITHLEPVFERIEGEKR